jgi:hypothetical protein
MACIMQGLRLTGGDGDASAAGEGLLGAGLAAAGDGEACRQQKL